jgi:hypothetical protein
MRKFFGTVLILAGVLSLTDYAILGSLSARDSLAKDGVTTVHSHFMLPLLAKDNDYPTAVTKLCFGIGLFFFGLCLVLIEGEMARSPLSLIFMLNSLLLCFSLLVAIAAFQNDKQAWIGIATAVALLHVVCGLVLLYFAATERPVGTAGLSLGSVIYVASAAVGAVVYLSGKAP